MLGREGCQWMVASSRGVGFVWIFWSSVRNLSDGGRDDVKMDHRACRPYLQMLIFVRSHSIAMSSSRITWAGRSRSLQYLVELISDLVKSSEGQKD